MTEPLQPATPTTHATHDPTWIAALAARDHGLEPAELVQARAALDSCDACIDLYADLVAVAAAVPIAAIPARPRSYTLTAADAARLRPAGWRRFLKAIGSARDGFTFPLAMGLTTIGIAGLLVATLPTLSAGTASSPTTLSAAGAPVQAAPGQESMSIGAETDQSPDELGGVFYGGEDGETASPGDRSAVAAPLEAAATGDDAGGSSVLVILAGTMLIIGLGLFALRWTAHRLGDG